MIRDKGNCSYIDSISSSNLTDSLNSIDPDLNLPLQANFNYYSTNDFRSNDMIENCTSRKYFSVLHSNIRSLDANLDNLTQMLTELNHNFSLIGLSETKYKLDRDQVLNSQIPGYSFVSQPSLSNAGALVFLFEIN